MRKETYQNNLSYIFEADRKNAKYSIDGGEHFMNHGDYCECPAKSVLGFEPKKDANTRADEGWDIEEIKASVKSWNCGLSDRKDLKGLGFDEFCKRFFADELPLDDFTTTGTSPPVSENGEKSAVTGIR